MFDGCGQLAWMKYRQNYQVVRGSALGWRQVKCIYLGASTFKQIHRLIFVTMCFFTVGVKSIDNIMDLVPTSCMFLSMLNA